MADEVERRQEEERQEGDSFAKYVYELESEYGSQESPEQKSGVPAEPTREVEAEPPGADQGGGERNFETYAKELREKYDEEGDNASSGEFREDSSSVDSATAFQDEQPPIQDSEHPKGTISTEQQTLEEHGGEGEHPEHASYPNAEQTSDSGEPSLDIKTVEGEMMTVKGQDEDSGEVKLQGNVLQDAQSTDALPMLIAFVQPGPNPNNEMEGLDAVTSHIPEGQIRSQSDVAIRKEVLETSGQTYDFVPIPAPKADDRITGRGLADLSPTEPEKASRENQTVEPTPKVPVSLRQMKSDTDVKLGNLETNDRLERLVGLGGAEASESLLKSGQASAEPKATEHIQFPLGEVSDSKSEIRKLNENDRHAVSEAFVRDFNRCRPENSACPALGISQGRLEVQANGKEIPLRHTRLSIDTDQAILKSGLASGKKPIYFWCNGESAGTSSLPFGDRLQSELRTVYSAAYPRDPSIFKASPELREFVYQRLKEVDKNNFNHVKGDISEEISRSLLLKLGEWKEIEYHPHDQTWQFYESNRKGPDSLQRSRRSGALSYWEFTWNASSPEARVTEALIHLRESPSYKGEPIRKAHVGTVVWDVRQQYLKFFIREAREPSPPRSWAIRVDGGSTAIHQFGVS